MWWVRLGMRPRLRVNTVRSLFDDGFDTFLCRADASREFYRNVSQTCVIIQIWQTQKILIYCVNVTSIHSLKQLCLNFYFLDSFLDHTIAQTKPKPALKACPSCQILRLYWSYMSSQNIIFQVSICCHRTLLQPFFEPYVLLFKHCNFHKKKKIKKKRKKDKERERK